VKVGALINSIILGTVTAGLTGLMLKSGQTEDSFVTSDYQYETLEKLKELPPDTPVVDLKYDFKDNNGKPPQLDPKSKLYLDNPENVKTTTEYDPASGTYKIKQKIGDMDYRPETYMTVQEYRDYMFKKSVHDYWKTKVAADDLSNRPKKGLVPKLTVNSELFDRIFGGNTVDIRPTGTAELIFGLNRNKTENPAIPLRQQKVTNFDFNMRIQLNLIGKIGDKLRVTTNYNTEASFDWENQVKMDYTGYEDEILKKIEAGNVTLPLNSTLITGSQSLFGVKLETQFGRLRMTTVLSQQRGKKQEVNVQGGAQTQQFSVNGENYEANKHYFLGHYFRDNYDQWMGSLPVISSPIVINRVEVYVLNQTGNQEQTRNIVALSDLGEDTIHTLKSLRTPANVSPSQYLLVDSVGDIPRNNANNLYKLMVDTANGLIKTRIGSSVKGILSNSIPASNIANPSGEYMLQARDYDVINNARRLNVNEFFVNPRLGYISLNQAINNDQVLAVSYQYTYNGKIYQVGEFSDQFPDNTKALVTKLLKGSLVSTRYSTWDLMMKNVYSLGAYNLNSQDFKLDIYYNNIETGVDIPYLPYGAVNGQQLIRVLNCDKLSVNGDRFSDGVYDFLKDYTINPTNGRVYLPTVEPFGSGLKAKFASADFPTANKYIFQELYDSTKVAASFITEKSRYKIRGTYRSASGSEIALNALNIPQGAVVVTANGVTLQENTDYTVDYTLGRVKIINEGILNSGSQIKVSVESNSLFNIQQKSLIANRFDFKVNRDLTIGGTFMRYNERPVTQKVNIGDEPVSNIVAGVDYNYKTDLPFLTRWIDKLPLISTKEMSSITTRGEFAKLFPGNAKAIGRDGNSYIDDFEGSISLIDIRSPNAWVLSSIPQGQPSLFPEAASTNTITTGNNRARLNWYTVDQGYTRSQSGITPSYYDKNIFSNNFWRQVLEIELFPNKGNPNGQPNILPLLDLSFYPNQRGQYNYDVNPTSTSAGMDAKGNLRSPQSRWGGIMRRLETNDFQAANIEYVQFWMMDPYNEDYKADTDSSFDAAKLPRGELFINLGNISEDILKDGRMSYENGLPGVSSLSQGLGVDTSNVAVTPLLPPIANAFSNDNNDRPFQDVGYDGMTDEREKDFFQRVLNDVNQFPGVDNNARGIQELLNDPSTDNFHFHGGSDYDSQQLKTLDRYRLFNHPANNTPTEEQKNALGLNDNAQYISNAPNIEDINRDNTLSETENYYQYRIKISPQDITPGRVGTNFLVDAFDGTADIEGIKKTVKWYQFKVPINQFESSFGDIEGFNSIRFMRVFMKGFDRPVVLRLARFELVRSDWRRYQFDLTRPGEFLANDDDGTSFDVSAVSVQENGTKTPVNYVIPPGIQQQQNIQTTNLTLLNEQALQMRTCNLKDGDSRAIFKNMDLDTRMFEHIRMFVHGEQLGDNTLNSGDLTVFVRVGSDYNNNYYEYEVPLQLTPKGAYDANSDDARGQVWPKENEIDIKFSDLSAVKANRNAKYGYFSNLNSLNVPFTQDFSGYKITVVGNPNLGTVKGVLVGIRNPKDNGRLAHCAEVWINELRLTDFNNQGGWAATAQMQAKLADLGQVALAGTYSTPFYGSVEKKVNERNKEENLNWDVSTNLNMGKFFPQNWKVTLPLFYNYGQTIVTPFFNPLDPDQKMNDVRNSDDISSDVKKKILKDGVDFTERKGINFSNVRIDGLKRKKAKPMPWDLSNFSFTYAYNETYRRNVNIENNVMKQYRGNIAYQFNFLKPPVLKPFAKSKSKLLNNKWMTLVKEFNLQLLPNSFGVTADGTRNYSELKNRDITSFYNQGEDLTFAQFNKQFLINRNYNLRWDLTKNLKYDFNATNEGRVLEPFGRVTKEYEAERDTVIDNFMKGGTNIGYRQAMNVNYTVPINKIPILDFATLTYRFGGTYSWTRRPFAAADSIGNTIQNTNTHNITANFNLITLYNKIPYFKRVNTGQYKNNEKVSKEAKNSKVALTDSTNPKKNDNFKDIAAFMAKAIMMVKNISITWQQTNGQALPNFKPTAQYGGMDFRNNQAPGFLFTTGLNDANIRQRAAQNDWLAKVPSQTSPYTETYSNNLTYRSSIEPHGSLRIELNGNLTKSRNLSEYMLYDPIKQRFDFGISPSETGNFNISTFSFFKSFTDKSTGAESTLFTEFLTRRPEYARDLASKNSRSLGVLKDSKGREFVDGYSINQQDVIIGAFYETYTGRKIRNYDTKNQFPAIPMPNWTISWDGLGKIKPLQKTFRSITVRHGYRSTYNIGGFSNNLLYEDRGGEQVSRVPNSSLVINGVTNTDIFAPYYTINAITITEGFAPLLKFDFQFVKTGWQANAEIKRDKTTTLNITGPSIIETKGREYIVGLGYRYPRLKLKKVKVFGKPLESDLNVKVDVSYRRNISVIRQIVSETSTPTGGSNILSLRSSADYSITQNITIRLFYDLIRNKPQTTASFPTSNGTGGFSLRINFQ
jgi:cell surface protein SprA